MLHNIYVKNLALIDEIEIELKKGLNILTGETGAGKSIILGSINLALGGRYSSDILRSEDEDGYVELTFFVEDLEQEELLKAMDIATDDGVVVLSRKMIGKRSVSKINGETVSNAQLKEAAGIPVIASGDVTDAASGMSMISETGCDMVMIGRAALGNPWIFRELDAAYRMEEAPPEPTDAEKIEMMLRHLDMLCGLKGERSGVREFRKYIMRYTKGMRGAASLRRMSNEIDDLDEMKRALCSGWQS